MIFKGVQFTCSDSLSDILIAELAELGFDSFSETDSGIKAFLKEDEEIPLAEVASLCQKYVSADKNLKYIFLEEKKQNWNQIWESSFEPVRVEDKCIVRAPFHKPEEGVELELIIEPKMSFGTGHHATTYLMLAELFSVEMEHKNVLDMGCGTSVLAIAAEKLGAKMVDAIDIEEWAYQNSLENIERNTCHNINVQRGDHHLITKTYDIILANINKNVLIQDMAIYKAHLSSNGSLLISGFYSEDATELCELAQGLHLKLKNKSIKNNWCMLHFRAEA